VHIIPLIAITAFFVLGIVGTVGKLVYDDWQLRRAQRQPIPVVSVVEEPANP
jgi:hypothetical protein